MVSWRFAARQKYSPEDQVIAAALSGGRNRLSRFVNGSTDQESLRRHLADAAGREGVSPQMHARRAGSDSDIEPIVDDDLAGRSGGAVDRLARQRVKSPTLEQRLADLNEIDSGRSRFANDGGRSTVTARDEADQGGKQGTRDKGKGKTLGLLLSLGCFQ